MKQDITDIVMRFVCGGGAVALTYIISLFVPWKSFAGIFAAFPAVMSSAIILTGIRYGDKSAADVAYGAIAGMLGCTFCVIGALFALYYFNNWIVCLVISTIIWFISAAICFSVICKIHQKVCPKRI